MLTAIRLAGLVLAVGVLAAVSVVLVTGTVLAKALMTGDPFDFEDDDDFGFDPAGCVGASCPCEPLLRVG